MSKRGEKNFLFGKNIKGQVTIFIIIAIVIVAGVVLFLFLRQGITITKIPASIQPVYDTFLSCLESRTLVGIDLLESQGGYIELPEFEPGSTYMPFGSQLNFLGNPIPYWYYVSANNFPKEQIPTEQEMEEALAKFIDDGARNCDFSTYYSEGFGITQKEPMASVDIKGNSVDVRLNMGMEITKGEDNALVNSHQINVLSNLGGLYNSAKTIYKKEQKDLFLENYGIDNLRLYAPVDGIEITCSPKTWSTDEVFANIQEAVETNTLALTTAKPSTSDEKYFFVDAGISQNARFINSRNWAYNLEVLPSKGNLLIAEPVGTQQGLGVLGFCYVPYHFVYNLKYPVLVQVYDGDETFQFPLAVVIQGNKPRESLMQSTETSSSGLCNYKNVLTTVKTYDANLNPVRSEISYECLGESCFIGEATSGVLSSEFPQCNNGYVSVRAEGFKETRQLFSTIQEGSVSIILDKLYKLNVNLKLNQNSYSGNAFIYFTSADDSKVVSYPAQKTIELSEGNYNVSVYIYKDSSIQFPASTSQECVEVPNSGIGGLFGVKDKKCFDIEVPSQLVSNVLAGGGTQSSSFSDGELARSTSIEINAPSFTTPTTMQQLQNNYLLFDESKLEINLI